jgi:hypothetical protein
MRGFKLVLFTKYYLRALTHTWFEFVADMENSYERIASIFISTLKVDVISSFETSIAVDNSIQRHSPEERNSHFLRRENIKPRKIE